MNKINLYNQNLTELTEENLIALCYLNQFKPEELTELNLQDNLLTDFNFIIQNTPFINLKTLDISLNDIKNLNNIKYLSNLEKLDISNLRLNNEKETIGILKTMKKLNYLKCYSVFKNYSK